MSKTSDFLAHRGKHLRFITAEDSREIPPKMIECVITPHQPAQEHDDKASALIAALTADGFQPFYKQISRDDHSLVVRVALADRARLEELGVQVADGVSQNAAPAEAGEKPKVLIASTNRFYSNMFKNALEQKGMEVSYTEDSPHHPANVQAIVDEIQKQKPDVFIIHGPNLELEESERACTSLVKSCKGTVPVIIHDTTLPEQFPLLKAEGAQLFGRNDSLERAVFAVAQSLRDKEKTGRRPG